MACNGTVHIRVCSSRVGLCGQFSTESTHPFVIVVSYLFSH